jgi:hypothetical protein
VADEKVLDIPAIDMTDAALAKRQSGRKTRRDGSIGRATFDAVNKLVADGSMTKQAAFAVYGKQTKTQPGTVSANYYRVARAEGTVSRKGRGTTAARSSATDVVSAKPARRGHPAASTGSGLDATLASLVSGMEELASALKQEQAETADLRRRLDGLRALV